MHFCVSILYVCTVYVIFSYASVFVATIYLLTSMYIPFIY